MHFEFGPLTITSTTESTAQAKETSPPPAQSGAENTAPTNETPPLKVPDQRTPSFAAAGNETPAAPCKLRTQSPADPQPSTRAEAAKPSKENSKTSPGALPNQGKTDLAFTDDTVKQEATTPDAEDVVEDEATKPADTTAKTDLPRPHPHTKAKPQVDPVAGSRPTPLQRDDSFGRSLADLMANPPTPVGTPKDFWSMTELFREKSMTKIPVPSSQSSPTAPDTPTSQKSRTAPALLKLDSPQSSGSSTGFGRTRVPSSTGFGRTRRRKPSATGFGRTYPSPKQTEVVPLFEHLDKKTPKKMCPSAPQQENFPTPKICPPVTKKRKVKIDDHCRYFNTSAGCREGSRCRFKHERMEGWVPPPESPRLNTSNKRPTTIAEVPCRFFNSKNGCREGKNCRFAHIADGRKNKGSKNQSKKAFNESRDYIPRALREDFEELHEDGSNVLGHSSNKSKKLTNRSKRRPKSQDTRSKRKLPALRPNRSNRSDSSQSSRSTLRSSVGSSSRSSSVVSTTSRSSTGSKKQGRKARVSGRPQKRKSPYKTKTKEAAKKNPSENFFHVLATSRSPSPVLHAQLPRKTMGTRSKGQAKKTLSENFFHALALSSGTPSPIFAAQLPPTTLDAERGVIKLPESLAAELGTKSRKSFSVSFVTITVDTTSKDSKKGEANITSDIKCFSVNARPREVLKPTKKNLNNNGAGASRKLKLHDCKGTCRSCRRAEVKWTERSVENPMSPPINTTYNPTRMPTNSWSI